MSAAIRVPPSSVAVLRKRLDVLLSVGLLVAVFLAFLTGMVASALDLNRFAYHKYAAYIATVLALVHAVKNWRALTGQIRRWLMRHPAAPSVRPQAQAAQLRTESDKRRLARRALLWPPIWVVAGFGIGRWLTSRGIPPELQEGQDLGQVYHQWSSPSYAGLLAKSLHVGVQPPLYKEYPNAPSVKLPPPGEAAGLLVETAIQRRRSIRDYGSRPLRLEELSRLLHYCTGITDRRDPALPLRAAPSSGALYPIETYPVIFNVDGVPPGVYHYNVRAHAIEQLRGGDFRQSAFNAALSQETVLGAALMIAFTGIFARVQWKYADRSYRYMLLETGHLGQNLYLMATTLGMGACAMGAFFDDQVNRLVGVDGKDEAALYLMAVGPLA